MTNCTDCPKSQDKAGPRWVAPRRDVPLSGILNVDKPPGMTSHDVVNEVRRLAGQRKVGHAGTLDPMATGVLLVCLGRATRVSEYLMRGRKRYRATVMLGTATDTYDAEGEVVSTGGSTDFARGDIESVLVRFVGKNQQIPPMYSAVKQGGRPLHELARQGKTVERAPRPVEIDAIELIDWTPPHLSIEVACSPGTYVRSLAHDLGQHLGCGAHLAALIRLGSGRFTLSESVSLERLAEAFEHGQEERYLLALDEAFLDQPAAIVGIETARRIAHGQAVDLDPCPGDVTDSGALVRTYGPEGEFLAIMTYDTVSGLWHPRKVFV